MSLWILDFLFFAAIQYASYRRLAGMPYATTMTTGNLRSMADYLYQRFLQKDATVDDKIKYIARSSEGIFLRGSPAAVY